MSVATPSRDPSAIFKTLSSLKDNVGATELSQELLRFISKESAEFLRNRYTVSEIFTYLHAVYESIHDRIDEVESLQTLDWTSFDKYTRAIPNLERALINFRLSSYKGSYGHTPVLSLADTQADLVGFIAAWEQNRKDLDEFAATIANPSLLALDPENLKVLLDGIKNKRIADDQDTIRAIRTWLGANSLTDQHLSRRPSQAVRRIKDSLLKTLDALYSRPPPNEELRVLFIKISFLALVPFSVLTTENGLTSDSTTNFKKSATWRSMAEHIVKFNTFISSPQLPEPATVKVTYEALWSLFFTGEGLVDLSADLISLMKSVPAVRRPFLARSVQLVQLLRQIDDYSAKSKTVDRGALKETITNVKASLDTASKAVTDVQSFLSESGQGVETTKTLAAAAQEVKLLAEEYGMDLQVATAFDKAVSEDEELFKRFISRIRPTA